MTKEQLKVILERATADLDEEQKGAVFALVKLPLVLGFTPDETLSMLLDMLASGLTPVEIGEKLSQV
jgi:hypothetical protein